MPRGCYMKQTLQNRFPRRWLLLAFVLNFAIAAAALLPYMIRDGGLLLVAADFDAEQLSYNMLCNNAIKSGEVLWNWRIDIGSDFVSSFSFYTLGSPFFWLSFLFPASAFPYLVGWIYMLKYAVAGLTSFAYFRRSASEKSALLGSVLYAFSGFSCINVVFYHFHDVIALFPLLMLGLDKRMQEGKKLRSCLPLPSTRWSTITSLSGKFSSWCFTILRGIFLAARTHAPGRICAKMPAKFRPASWKAVWASAWRGYCSSPPLRRCSIIPAYRITSA